MAKANHFCNILLLIGLFYAGKDLGQKYARKHLIKRNTKIIRMREDLRI